MYFTPLEEKVIIIALVVIAFAAAGTVMLWGEWLIGKVKDIARNRYRAKEERGVLPGNNSGGK